MDNLQKIVLIGVVLMLLTSRMRKETFTTAAAAANVFMPGMRVLQKSTKRVGVVTVAPLATQTGMVAQVKFDLNPLTVEGVPVKDLEAEPTFFGNILKSFSEKLGFWIAIGVLFLAFLIALIV
jgi:hypothetical protein